MPEWSVVVCCYNSQSRIGNTLHKILDSIQARTPGSVELVIVDNACTDRTVEIVTRASAERSFHFLKVVREDRAGLMYARIAGVNAAVGKFIAFVDDDNWPCERYFSIAEAVFNENIQVGVFGCASVLPLGQCIPEPLEKYAMHFAVGPQPFKPGRLAPGLCVWGAGMALRRDRLKAVLDTGFEPVLVGRLKCRQSAGDDTELVSVMALAGSGVWYEDEPLITHAVDTVRFSREKLRMMFEGFGGASIFIDKYALSVKGVPIHMPFMFPLLAPFIFAKDVFLLAIWSLKNMATGPDDLDSELRKKRIISKWKYYLENPTLSSLQKTNIVRMISLRKADSTRRR